MSWVIRVITLISLLVLMFKSESLADHSRGDPGVLLPSLDVKHVFPPQLNTPRLHQPQIKLPLKVVPTKGDTGDLLTEETRNKKGRQSYNREYKPRRTNYNHQDRHSDGKKTKGGYHASDSYNGKNGYSTYSSYDRANRDNYGDSDHKQYGNKGGKNGGGGGNYGGGSTYGNHDESY